MISLLRGRKDDPPHLKRLRMMVIAMGLLLMAGVATVVTRIVYLASQQQAALTEVKAAGVVSGGASGGGGERALTSSGGVSGAGEMHLVLPHGATVRSHAVSGQNLSVLYDGPAGSGIIVFDLANGKQVSVVRLESAVK